MKRITLIPYVFVSLVLALVFSACYSFATEIKPGHLYSKGSQEEAKALLKKWSGEIPKLPGADLLGRSAWALNPDKANYTENIKIDGKDMVIIVSTEPIYEATIHYMKSAHFVQNGFFISDVDLESINCRILRKEGNVKKIPRGAYVWHIGDKGVLLERSMGISWIILFEKAVEGFPTSYDIALQLEMQPMGGSTEGFQIGPTGRYIAFGSKPEEIKPPDFPTIKMKVYDEKENNK